MNPYDKEIDKVTENSTTLETINYIYKKNSSNIIFKKKNKKMSKISISLCKIKNFVISFFKRGGGFKELQSKLTAPRVQKLVP